MSIITCAGVSGHTPGWLKRTAKCTEYTELVSSSRQMSEYYESLGSSEKVMHIAKLEAVGLTLEDD